MYRGNPEALSAPPVVAQFITVRQLAEEIDVHPRTIHRWMRRSEIPAHRIGRKIVFSRAKLEALVTGMKGVENGQKEIAAPEEAR